MAWNEMTKNLETTGDVKRKVGRPSKGKRGNFTFRLTDALREKLVAAAEKSDLSISEEIERRLDRSFISEDQIGPVGAELAHMVTLAAMLAGPDNRAVLRTAMQTLVEGYFNKITSARRRALLTAALLTEPSDPDSGQGHRIAMAILEQAGLAEPFEKIEGQK